MAPAGPKQNMTPEYRAKYQAVMDALNNRANSSYTLLYEPHLVKNRRGRKKAGAQKGKTKPSAFLALNPKPEPTQKNKPHKKATNKKVADKFLPNVRALTGTGMLDGAAVRYINKRKEIELRGVIKGSSYLCGCASCNYSKTVSAEEFERHAGSETSHANNHIHFENGKSMHMVVKELNNTPESMLFDVIQTLTGSPLNQEAFSTWKGSYKARQ